MVRLSLGLFLIVALVVLPAFGGDGADPIGDALVEAKAEHDASVKRAREQLLVSLDELTKSIASSGDLNAVKAVLAQKQAYQAGGSLPTDQRAAAARAAYEQAIKSANEALVVAHETAVSEYTKKLDIEKATSVQEQLTALKQKLHQPGEDPTQQIPASHPVAPSRPIRLHVKATIDGLDGLRLDSRKAVWVHRERSWPTNVELNGVAWQPHDDPILLNEGSTRFLGDVDFATAKVIDVRGRSHLDVRKVIGGLHVTYNDTAGGAGAYELTVEFQPARTAPTLVIWNQYNANARDRGSKQCDVRLFHGQKQVAFLPDIQLAWDSIRPETTRVFLPSVTFDRVRIDIKQWFGGGGGLAEVAIMDRHTNLAQGASANASAVFDERFVAAKVTDGISDSAKMGRGYWLLPGNTPGWIEIQLPRPIEVTDGPAPAEEKPVYLSDLSPTHVQTLSNRKWGFGTKGLVGHGSGRKITVNGKLSPNGLGTHPPRGGKARIEYNIDHQYRSFLGAVAINDGNPQAWSPITFQINGDGSKLWTSKPIQTHKQPQQFEVDVRGIKQLALIVHCPGHNHAANAVWIEPRLYPDTTPPPHHRAGRLVILEAKYGGRNRWKDVTAIVAGHVKNQGLVMTVTNGAFGGDPVPGVRKVLVVRYRIGSEVHTKRFAENAQVRISAPDGVAVAYPDDIDRPDHGDGIQPIKRVQSTVKGLMVRVMDNGNYVGFATDIISTCTRGTNRRHTRIRQRVGTDMNTSFDEAVRAVKLRYPKWETAQIDISFAEKYSEKDGGSAGMAFALLLLSVLEGFEIDPGFALTGDIAVNWKIQPVGGVAAKIRGAILDDCAYVAIPVSSAQAMGDLLVMNGTKQSLASIQVFTVDSLQETVRLVRTDRDENLAQAMALYESLQAAIETMGLAHLNSTQAQTQLKRILELAPNHLSAEYALMVGQKSAPRTLSRSASMVELFSGTRQFNHLIWGPQRITRQSVSGAAVHAARRHLRNVARMIHPDIRPLYRTMVAFIGAVESAARAGSSHSDAAHQRVEQKRQAVLTAINQIEADREMMEKLLREGF